MNAAISLENLTKTFGEHRAVDDLSLEIPQGTIFGLLGRNGAGKTTIIRMIMDILRPDSGTVRILGNPMGNNTKDRIGYLPEERGLYPKMKVIEMLEFQGSIKNLSLGESRKRGTAWLDRMDLGKWKTKKVEDLSKGMQQKVQFISAVMTEPQVLILDEPFSGMDPVNQEIFKDLILELNRSGSTIVFSTHVMDSAERLCRQIALIDHGRPVLDGSLASIKETFGTNTIQMAFSGDGSFLRDLPGVENAHDNGQQVELRLHAGADPQSVLRAAVGRLEIRHFSLVNPTLHSIFIQQVGKEATDA